MALILVPAELPNRLTNTIENIENFSIPVLVPVPTIFINVWIETFQLDP